jgi:hypothetical protein
VFGSPQQLVVARSCEKSKQTGAAGWTARPDARDQVAETFFLSSKSVRAAHHYIRKIDHSTMPKLGKQHKK